MKPHKLLFLLFLAIIQGCATSPKFDVNVNSISGTDSNLKNRYLLVPGLKDVNPDDLQFQEYSGYAEKALSQKGFVKANNFNDADVVIFMSYGIGEPQVHQYTYAVPTWGQTGVSSANTSGTVSAYGNSASYNTRTTYTPQYGITGHTTQIGTAITYTRYLQLDAIDVAEYKKSNSQKEVWKTTVMSTGTSSDLRQVMPVMVGASSEYLGTNTGKNISVNLKETDKRVLKIKQ